MPEIQTVSRREQKKKAQEALTAWLRPVPWQVLAHLTFPWQALQETALSALKRWTLGLQQHMRTRVGLVYTAETRSKGGWSVPLHLHLALTALKPLDVDFMKETWKGLVGRSNARGAADDTILLQPYDEARSGLSYIVKQAYCHDSTWGMHSLEFFHPEIDLKTAIQRRSLQRIRRWERQKLLLGGAATAQDVAAPQ